MAEEKALLERNRASTALLTELSVRVEHVTAVAVERETRVARALDDGLLAREARCAQAERALDGRELSAAAREREADALRGHLAGLAASMEHELFLGQADLRQARHILATALSFYWTSNVLYFRM